MQAKPLHHASAHRADLLSQARDHYRRAAVITEAEGNSAVSRLSRASDSSLASSSSCLSPSLLQSPVLTEDNGGMSTRTCSPDPSVFSDRGEDVRAAAAATSRLVKKHHRKQVSFGDLNIATEPFVRPDSPTLGPDDALSPTSPVLVSPTMVPLSRFNKSPPGMRTIVLLGEDSEEEEEEEEGENEEEQAESGEEKGRQGGLRHALGNYSSTLSSLRQQINTHMSAVDTRTSPSLSSTDSEEMRQLDLEARIGRLREGGWRRRRFDAAKYEALREAALADMSG